MSRNARSLELLDAEGGYLYGRVLDDDLLRVIVSNVFPRDATLLKREDVGWSDLLGEVGEGKVTVPQWLVTLSVPPEDEDAAYDSWSLHGEDVIQEAHRRVEARALRPIGRKAL